MLWIESMATMNRKSNKGPHGLLTVFYYFTYFTKNNRTDLLVLGELWGILGFGLEHHLDRKSNINLDSVASYNVAFPTKLCIIWIFVLLLHFLTPGDSFYDISNKSLNQFLQVQWIQKTFMSAALKRSFTAEETGMRRVKGGEFT